MFHIHFQVLPKQVSTPRHIFLAECFGDNPLLFEVCIFSVLVQFAGYKLLAVNCFSQLCGGLVSAFA
jgi:hypothetical protein